LLTDITDSFYTKICRGLFEKDKLLYSFLNASSILRRGGDITADEWNVYLRGSPTSFKDQKNEIDYITDVTFWKLLGLEECHFSFKDIVQSFKDANDAEIWKRVIASEDPPSIPMPTVFDDRLSAFQKLMVI